jgi:hypothetical protein
MRKFKELVNKIYEATGAASKAAARDFLKSRKPSSVPGVSQLQYDNRAAAIEFALMQKTKKQAEARIAGQQEGERKAARTKELMGKISATTKEASEGTGVKKQIEDLKAGETIGVDLVDGGFGYVHHDPDTGTKFFAKGNRERAHPIHSTPVQPDHVQITTPKKSGKNIQFPVVGKIHHRDATPVKSGRIDRRTGAFITDHDINT